MFGKATLRGGQTLLHDVPHVGPTGALGDHRLCPRGRPLPLHSALQHHDGLRLAHRRHGDPGGDQAVHWILSQFGPDARVGGGTEEPQPDRGHRRGPENRTDTQAHARDGPLLGMDGRGMGSGRDGCVHPGVLDAGPAPGPDPARARGGDGDRARAPEARAASVGACGDGPSFRGRGGRPCRIAGIPWPKRAETQHTIVSGTTGSGKTVLISDLVAQIRARGGALHRLRQDGNLYAVLLRPRQRRAHEPAGRPRSSLVAVLRGEDAARLRHDGRRPYPAAEGTPWDPFWVTAARQLFSNGAGSALDTEGDREPEARRGPAQDRAVGVGGSDGGGTVAQSIVSPDNPKTALSVRAMLTAHLGALEFLPDTGAPFSIRDWVGREDETGFLFLTSRGDQHASLRGTHLHVARDRGQTRSSRSSRTARAGYGSWLGRAADASPGAEPPAGACGVPAVRRLLRAGYPGVLVPAGHLREERRRDHLRALRHPGDPFRARPGDPRSGSAESLGRGEVEEYTQGMSYGASTMRGRGFVDAAPPDAPAGPCPRRSCGSRTSTATSSSRVPSRSPPSSSSTSIVPASAERFVPRKGDAAPVDAGPPPPRVDPEGDDAGRVDEPVDGEAFPPAGAPEPSGEEGGGRPAPARSRCPRSRTTLRRRDNPPARGLGLRCSRSGPVRLPGPRAQATTSATATTRRGAPGHKSASAWAGKGAAELGLHGEVDAEVFCAVLEGTVPDGSGHRLGRRGKDGETLPPSRARPRLLGPEIGFGCRAGGAATGRIADAHDRAVKATLGWVERNAAETRVRDAGTGRMVRVRRPGDRCRHVRARPPRGTSTLSFTPTPSWPTWFGGPDRKWRTMANEGPLRAAEAHRHALPERVGAEPGGTRLTASRRTHADGRFEIAGRSARGGRVLLDPQGRDRGGDGSAGSRRHRREPPALPSAPRS